MYGLRYNRVSRLRVVGAQYESANLGLIAQRGFYITVVAYILFLYLVSSWLALSETRKATSAASGDGHAPTNSSSLHSKITRLTIGSSSPGGVAFTNFVRTNGSVSPPQAFLLYMPEHCCLLLSFSFCKVVRPHCGHERNRRIQSQARWQSQKTLRVSV